jgi:hypothetical protein
MFVIGFAATRWLGIVYTVFRYFGSCRFGRTIAYASELDAGYSAHPPPVAAAGEEALSRLLDEITSWRRPGTVLH